MGGKTCQVWTIYHIKKDPVTLKGHINCISKIFGLITCIL